MSVWQEGIRTCCTEADLRAHLFFTTVLLVAVTAWYIYLYLCSDGDD